MAAVTSLFHFIAGEMIMNKWANIRDAFLRSLRTKTGKGARKKYIYSEHLQFLLKLAEKEETESNFRQCTVQGVTKIEEISQSLLEGADISSVDTPPVMLTGTEHRASRNKCTEYKRGLDFMEREILTEPKKVKHSENAPRPDATTLLPRTDHEMLLLSFLPYTRDMSETELMDLQMAILKNIKEIKDRRHGSNSRILTDTYQSSQHTDYYSRSPSPSTSALPR